MNRDDRTHVRSVVVLPAPGDVQVATAVPEVNAYRDGAWNVRWLAAELQHASPRRSPYLQRLLDVSENALAVLWQAAQEADPRLAELARLSVFGE